MSSFKFYEQPIDFKYHEQTINFNVKFGEVYTVARSEDDGTYILVTPDGEEIPAAVVKELTVFDATANDIREGKTAATETGVTVGTKFIPSYHTNEGVKAVPSGCEIALTVPSWDYTKFQAIVCAFNTNMKDSVSAEQVAINDSVYNVQSTDAISVVVKDTENARINFGITNTSDKPCLIRYFMYKEIY